MRPVALALVAVLLAAAPAAARSLPPSGADPLGGASGAARSGTDVTAPGQAPLSTDHPVEPVRYTAEAEVVRGRVGILVEDTTDPAAPRRLGRIEVGAIQAPRAVAVDPVGDRLYVAVGATTQVLDLDDPRAPERVGRVADYHVRSHEVVQAVDVQDPVLGRRSLLLIGSRLGGAGCWTGTLHVYDVTGILRETPVTVLASDVPRLTADACPAARISVDGDARRLRVVWTAEGTTGTALVRSDAAPYDITAAFAARAGICRIVA